MKIFIFIFAITTHLHAETFKIGGKTVKFTKKEGLILKGCKKGCEALRTIKKFKRIDLEKIRQGMKYHNSVGSDVCDKAYRAESLLGVTSNLDGRAFCVFKDRSMVEINSLSEYLTKKKIIH